MYKVKIEQFSGPFDLLLNLVEKEQLDICDISLAKVADKFLIYIDRTEHIHTRDLADFLEIAAKLVLAKSKLLIPDMFLQDEDNVDDLIDKLKIYRKYANAAKKVAYLSNIPYYSFSREKIPIHVSSEISIDLNISVKTLEKNFKNIVSTILEQVKLSQKIIKRKIISLKQKITELLDLIKERKKIILNQIIKQRPKKEQAVMFLAVLELIKQKQIIVRQKELFGEIIISKL